jgi:hypothetical protein
MALQGMHKMPDGSLASASNKFIVSPPKTLTLKHRTVFNYDFGIYIAITITAVTWLV